MAKVLVVEDNDLLNKSYGLILRHNGYEVETAFDGQEGLKKAADFQPNLILLDYLMPVMDGKEFLQQFKPADHPAVKVILLTNIAEEKKIGEAYALGICCHLLKSSLAPHELIEQIEKTLK